MVKSGSRRRTRKVAAGVLDRLAAQEGAESRSRKRSTRKVSAQILDTLRDHTNTVPSVNEAPARAPGYGIVKRRRVKSQPVPEPPTTQEHARILPPTPPDTGSTLDVDLRPAVDLAPPPLRVEPDTNPEMMIGGGAFDPKPKPKRRVETPAAEFTPELPPPVVDEAPPAEAEETTALTAHTPSEDAAAIPIDTCEDESAPQEWSAPSVVVSDSAFAQTVPLAEPTPIEVAPPSPVLPGETELVPVAAAPRGFFARVREFFGRLSAVWRSTQ